MSTLHAVLALLARGARHGYELQRELEELDRGWTVEHGQLYRLLAKLRRQKLVAERLESGRGGPSRKVYSITRAGRRELELWLSEPGSRVRPARDELPLKLLAGRAVGAPGRQGLIEARRRALEMEGAMAVAARERALDAGDPDRWLVAETCVRHVEGALEALVRYQRLTAKRESRLDGCIASAGSDDPALDMLARHVESRRPGVTFTTRALGSLGGLLALRRGSADLAGTHLLDLETGEYNVPYVKRLLFEEPVLLVNLSFREQGLMLARDNPRSIRSVADLGRPGLRIANRQQGAGTRLLLHTKLVAAGIEPTKVAGYDRELPTHDSAAEAVAEGEADAAMGIRAVAEGRGLAFVPVALERYDLAIPKRSYETEKLRPLREALGSGELRRDIGSWPGYDASRLGEVVAEVV